MFKNNVDPKKNNVGSVENNKKTPLIRKIPSIFVADDCVQLMVHYNNSMITLGDKGIIFNGKDGEIYKHDYIDDDRKISFPYSSIPSHYDKEGTVVNQILEFGKSYVYLIDGHLFEKYITKYEDEAYVFTRILRGYQDESVTMTYEELKTYLSKENNKGICINMDGTIPNEDELIPSEEEIYNRIKIDYKDNVEKLHNLNDESSPYAFPYIGLNKWFIKYLDNTSDNLDFSLIDFNYEREQPLLVAKYSDDKIKLECLKIIFKRKDEFEIIKYPISVNDYSIEKLQNIRVSNTNEPNISLKLNPNIDKEDLEREKRLYKKLTK